MERRKEGRKEEMDKCINRGKRSGRIKKCGKDVQKEEEKEE